MGWLDSLDTTLAIATTATGDQLDLLIVPPQTPGPTARNATTTRPTHSGRRPRSSTQCPPSQQAVTSSQATHAIQGREFAMAASISTTRSSAPRAPATARVTRRELVGSALRRRAERIRGRLVVLVLLLPLLITVLMGGR